jgi:uncharacterized DUF497 family protein
VQIVWDEPKRAANLEKHGFDFADVDDFDWAAAFIAPSYGGRFKAIGLFRDQTIVVVYSYLGTEAISIIGMRPASTRERRLYEAED